MIDMPITLVRMESAPRNSQLDALPVKSDVHLMRACSPTRLCRQNFACKANGKEVALLKRDSGFNHYGFDSMVAAFKASGGTARADDFALLLEQRKTGNFISLAKQLVSRDIFSFEFKNHFWIPMFQFNLHDLTVSHEAKRVVDELAAVLDSLMLALWFTEPNAWLKSRRPVDMMEHFFSDVLAAARADRFVARG